MRFNISNSHYNGSVFIHFTTNFNNNKEIINQFLKIELLKIELLKIENINEKEINIIKKSSSFYKYKKSNGSVVLIKEDISSNIENIFLNYFNYELNHFTFPIQQSELISNIKIEEKPIISNIKIQIMIAIIIILLLLICILIFYKQKDKEKDEELKEKNNNIIL